MFRGYVVQPRYAGETCRRKGNRLQTWAMPCDKERHLFPLEDVLRKIDLNSSFSPTGPGDARSLFLGHAGSAIRSNLRFASGCYVIGIWPDPTLLYWFVPTSLMARLALDIPNPVVQRDSDTVVNSVDGRFTPRVSRTYTVNGWTMDS